MIEITNIHKSYKMGDTLVHALKGVSLKIEEGDYVAIMGPSGSGKSTLSHILGLLDIPTSGSYKIYGKEVSKYSEDELALLRRTETGFIFQQFHLLPTLTVAENVELPLLFLGRATSPTQTSKVLELVGLADRASHLPKELSGGQMQRVAIARALIVKPKILIADEPTGNLDRAAGQAIFALFRKLVSEEGLTIIITTHNLAFGYEADRVITLEDGRIVREEVGRVASSLHS